MDLRKQRTKTVIVFGATGMLGTQITKKLLDSGFNVRVFVRSKQKLFKIFQAYVDMFDLIIQGKLSQREQISKIFQNGDSKSIQYVISALGARPQDKGMIQDIQYKYQKDIAWECKKNNISKLIFMSAALMQRPWHPATVFLNTIIPNVFHWKSQAQNYIRELGIDYIIIRPPYLSDSEQETSYKIGQGDKLLGRITRKTVAIIVRDILNLENLPSQVTFECTQSPFNQLRHDTEANIVKCNHKRAKYTYWILFSLLILLIIGTAGYFLH